MNNSDTRFPRSSRAIIDIIWNCHRHHEIKSFECYDTLGVQLQDIIEIRHHKGKNKIIREVDHPSNATVTNSADFS